MTEQKKHSLTAIVTAAALFLTIVFNVIVFTFGYGKLENRVTNLEIQLMEQKVCIKESAETLNKLREDVAAIRMAVELQNKLK